MAVLNDVAFRFVPDDSANMSNDWITGRDEQNRIDLIDGGGGEDYINGQAGPDALIGGLGEDTVFGGNGGNIDLLLGGSLDVADGVDPNQLAADVLAILGDADLGQIQAGLADILNNATSLQDIVQDVSAALSDNPDLLQAAGELLQTLQGNLVWEQDYSVDTFKSAGSFAENGVDIIGGYDDGGSSPDYATTRDAIIEPTSSDIIDFSDAIDLYGYGPDAKAESLDEILAYNPDTGALTNDGDPWFFVFSDLRPADTVVVDVDGYLFEWDNNTQTWTDYYDYF